MSKAKLPTNPYDSKEILIAGLKLKISEMPELRSPFEITKNSPSKETFPMDEDHGTYIPTRRIVIKRPNVQGLVYGIGDIYSGEIKHKERKVMLDGTVEEEDSLQELIAEGWVERHTFEISVWTNTNDDRDACVDIIKRWVLELTHKPSDEDGFPFFLRNGVIFTRFIRSYEAEDRNLINSTMHIGTLVFHFDVPFYGISVEEYDRIKVNLLDRIKNPPEIIIPIGGNTSLDTGCITEDCEDCP